MTIQIAQGTGPLKMWNVYCDDRKCRGIGNGKIHSFNRKIDAKRAASQHAQDHEGK